MMLHVQYCIQILAPSGAASLYLLFRNVGDALVLDSSQHRQPLISTVWGAICGSPAGFAADMPLLLPRVREVFQKPILRLQIPVWLLEQGLGAPDRHIRILLWATGLDGITRSGGTAAFAGRLRDLLGSDTQIFPSDASNRQPKYTVAEVAEDLYQLRNEMAHGLPFHEKFRKKRGFQAETGSPVAEEFANWRYDHVLEECAGFLLCKALREIFLRNCFFDVRRMEWRSSSDETD
jgi:hypothetical protein